MNDLQPIEAPKRGRRPTIKGESVNEISREDVAHNPKNRGRIPMSGDRQYITFPEHRKDKNYHYRMCADDGANIEMRIDAGYEFVLNEDGSKYTRRGRDGVMFYAMRQPIEFRNEDLELKRKQNSATLLGEQKLKAGEYIPDGRTSIVQRDSDLIDPMAG